MRTPKPLDAHERMIYQPEFLTCPHCGDLLVTCNSLAWDKTVQMLDRVLSVASRREQGDAGGNFKTPVEWPVLFICHSNPEKPPHACQTATRHLS